VTQYLVAIHLPDDFDYAVPNPAAGDIAALNREMVAAGVRVFVGGLAPVGQAKSVTVRAGGRPLVTDGPYLETKEHIGGFWVLDCPSEAEALDWGRKAAIACRAPVEVRAFNPPL
jgi:hypothetical protein